ncbi:MAG: RES family NAD+ phosphorylase [Saprospiraceae bacterium]|nr:RES family NAD+ phosphorylase [Saprospiraceae bacterium]
MRLFRIARQKYIHDLSGEGARLYGGRWNYPGTPVLYTSEHRSLALLEVLVHYDALAAIRQEYACMEIELEDALIQNVELKITQTDTSYTDYEISRKTADRHFQDYHHLAIKVPSVIVPQEYNVVIHTAHSDFTGVKVVKVEPVRLDHRIFTSK